MPDTNEHSGDLVTRLAELFPDVDDVGRIAAAAGLPRGKIDLEGSALDAWTDAVQHLHARRQLDALLREAARGEPSLAPELERLVTQYKKAHPVQVTDDHKTTVHGPQSLAAWWATAVATTAALVAVGLVIWLVARDSKASGDRYPATSRSGDPAPPAGPTSSNDRPSGATTSTSETSPTIPPATTSGMPPTAVPTVTTAVTLTASAAKPPTTTFVTPPQGSTAGTTTSTPPPPPPTTTTTGLGATKPCDKNHPNYPFCL